MLIDCLSLPEDLPADQLGFEWGSADEHIAPPGETPLSRALQGKTNAGVITFIAGCALLCAKRLERIGDTRRLVMLSECLLCFEASPHYYSGYRRPKPASPPPAVEQVISAIFTRATAVFQQLPGEHSSFPPMSAAKNIVALTKLVLGPNNRKYLENWIKTAVGRLNQFAPNDNQVFKTRLDFETEEEWQIVKRRNFGVPVPLEVLNDKIALTESDLPRLYADFLKSVKWRENPYLRSPDALVEAGFQGTAYQWPA